MNHAFSTSPPQRSIGIWDSGVGGLSVLQALRRQLPQADLHYLADAAYAPYGDRSLDEVVQRSKRVTAHLLEAGACMVVVACNTATTAAIGALRAEWPQVPIVGVEPGVKPAAALSPTGRIAVLATRRTIQSTRLQALVEMHAPGCEVVLQACPGLVEAIEAGTAGAPRAEALLSTYCEPLKVARVDTVVLGCTHYVFVAHLLPRLLGPGVRIIDTADAVARRAASLWLTPSDNGQGSSSESESVSVVSEQRAQRGPIEVQSAAIARAMASICNDERASLGVMSGHERNALRLSVLLQTTGDAARLSRFARQWLALEAPVTTIAM